MSDLITITFDAMVCDVPYSERNKGGPALFYIPISYIPESLKERRYFPGGEETTPKSQLKQEKKDLEGKVAQILKIRWNEVLPIFKGELLRVRIGMEEMNSAPEMLYSEETVRTPSSIELLSTGGQEVRAKYTN